MSESQRRRRVRLLATLLSLALLLLISSPVRSDPGGLPGNGLPTRGATVGAPASATTLVSVAVAPAASSMSTGGNLSLTPTPVCSPGPCPAGITYQWSLTRSLGRLDYTVSNSNSASLNIPTGGEEPTGIAYDASNGDLYVTNDESTNGNADSSVAVISGATDTLLGVIRVGGSPTGIAYDPDNGDLYVTNCGSGNISVISGATNTVVTSFPFTLTGCTIGAKMFMNFAGVAYDVNKHTLYASNYGNGTVSEVNTSTDTVVRAISVGGEPWGLVYVASVHDLYVSEFDSPYLGVIDTTTDTLIRQVALNELPSGVDYDPANGAVYVADASYWVKDPAGNGNVAVVNTSTNTLTAMIPTKGYPWSVAYDRGNGCLYETDSNVTVMNVISTTTNTVVGTVPLGRTNWGYSNNFADVYDPANGRVYVTGFNSTMVEVVTGAEDADTFMAGSTAGSVGVLVNATWNGTTVQSAAAQITITGGALPSLASVSVSPSSDRLAPGGAATFSAVAACTGGACPPGTSFSWSLTNALGHLGSATGPSTTFTAGGAVGADTLFVNASLNGRTVVGAPVTISIATGSVPTLSSVSVSPSGATLGPGGSAPLSATPGCSGGPCPPGSSFAWTATNNLGSFNQSTGASVTFTASGVGGEVVLFVNVSLNGAVLQSSPVVVLVQSPSISTVSGVAIYPSIVTLPLRGAQHFSAEPLCLPYPCPTRAIAVSWSLENATGYLSAASGLNVTFLAGLDTGQDHLTVRLTLAGRSVFANASITISVSGTSSPPASSWSAAGVPLLDWGLIGAGGLILGGLLLVILRRPRATNGSKVRVPPPKSSPDPEETEVSKSKSESGTAEGAGPAFSRDTDTT